MSNSKISIGFQWKLFSLQREIQLQQLQRITPLNYLSRGTAQKDSNFRSFFSQSIHKSMLFSNQIMAMQKILLYNELIQLVAHKIKECFLLTQFANKRDGKSQCPAAPSTEYATPRTTLIFSMTDGPLWSPKFWVYVKQHHPLIMKSCPRSICGIVRHQT